MHSICCGMSIFSCDIPSPLPHLMYLVNDMQFSTNILQNVWSEVDGLLVWLFAGGV